MINVYFERKLNSEEQRQFEELYENDAEFREEVAFREDLKKVVTRQERGQIKERLQQLKSIQQVSPEVNKASLRNVLAYSVLNSKALNTSAP